MVVSTVAFGVGRAGSWLYLVEHDPLEDRPTIKLVSPAVEGVGRMAVICEGLFVEMIVVDWQSYIGFEADTLKYKFDDTPVVMEEAVMATNGQAVIFEDHGVFHEMQKHDKLYIRAQAGERVVADTLTFDLNGFNEVVKKTEPDCLAAL